ncbi:hypothetical protein QAD02_003911 [Eretmocerus hayati]|uniref:Uncharacterized protein n=1 Tax=Eretmocerus hayati TaxID=131215 RepID=A0ACC2NNG2_9HYME|nr:hypothetical protein QAD02_003911 [Eretmocerus hayati]
MEDQLSEGLCNILQRLWSANADDDYYSGDVEDFKPHTVDGVPIRKLFVGNLAQRTTFKDLIRVFSSYGKLDCCYIRRNPGKSNYAFVTFNSVEDALRATKDGHRKKIHIHNRDLRVMPADSWHQPDSIEVKNKKVQESLKEETRSYILDGAEIHKLNDDCLMHIFTYLPIIDRVRVEGVCRRWKDICPESWRTFKKLDLTRPTWGFKAVVHKSIDTPTLRKVLLRCGQFITHIDLSKKTEKLSKSTLSVIGRFCPNLQYIDVTAINVSPAGIKALAENCMNITDFSLGHCTTACDNDLSQLFAKNKRLQSVKILQNSILGKCFLSLPADSMRSITLSECTNVSPCHFETAIRPLKNLETLSLEKCVSFNDQAVKAISQCSSSLKILHLRDYYPMVSQPAMLTLAGLVNLDTLDVAQNVTVHDEFLKLVGTRCKLLTNVDISSCQSVTNAGLASIVSLPKLQHLSVNYLGKITDTVLVDMPNLRTMHCRGCPNLKNEGLCNLIEESHQIELLDLSGCNEVSNELIEAAINATTNRTNNVVLRMYIGDTKVKVNEITRVSPFLQVVDVDLSEPYLRPDFDHDEYEFFPDELYDIDDDLDDYDSFFANDSDEDMHHNYYEYYRDEDSDEEFFFF